MSRRRALSLIERYCEENSISIAELARRSGKSWRAVYRVARRQARVSPEMASALQRGTSGGLSAVTLLGLEAA